MPALLAAASLGDKGATSKHQRRSSEDRLRAVKVSSNVRPEATEATATVTAPRAAHSSLPSGHQPRWPRRPGKQQPCGAESSSDPETAGNRCTTHWNPSRSSHHGDLSSSITCSCASYRICGAESHQHGNFHGGSCTQPVEVAMSHSCLLSDVTLCEHASKMKPCYRVTGS